MTKALIFDWGDTLMRDLMLNGPMWKWDNVELVKGVDNALISLSDNYNMVVATSADHSDTNELIKALNRVGLDKYFNHFFSQKELGFKKPDPRFFKSVIDQIKSLPDECIMIGNSYEKDIIGAKSTGLKTILFNENKQSGQFPKADKVIVAMDDLISAIDELAI